MDFFKVGKKDSYVLLQAFLTSSTNEQLTSVSSSDNIGMIKNQLMSTKKLRQSSSFSRLPSDRSIGS